MRPDPVRRVQFATSRCRPDVGSLRGPHTPSVAAKKRMPLYAVMKLGSELLGPGGMSLTITVPRAVPSDLHSSKPLTPKRDAVRAVAACEGQGAADWARV